MFPFCVSLVGAQRRYSTPSFVRGVSNQQAPRRGACGRSGCLESRVWQGATRPLGIRFHTKWFAVTPRVFVFVCVCLCSWWLVFSAYPSLPGCFPSHSQVPTRSALSGISGRLGSHATHGGIRSQPGCLLSGVVATITRIIGKFFLVTSGQDPRTGSFFPNSYPAGKSH